MLQCSSNLPKMKWELWIDKTKILPHLRDAGVFFLQHHSVQGDMHMRNDRDSALFFEEFINANSLALSYLNCFIIELN